MEQYKERCKDCTYLEERNGQWYCDSCPEYCNKIEECHEV